MDGYFETPKLYIEGSRTKITIYRLKEEKEIPDFWNIIKYKEFQERPEGLDLATRREQHEE